MYFLRIPWLCAMTPTCRDPRPKWDASSMIIRSPQRPRVGILIERPSQGAGMRASRSSISIEMLEAELALPQPTLVLRRDGGGGGAMDGRSLR